MITAAHCVSGENFQNPSQLRITAGDHHLYINETDLEIDAEQVKKTFSRVYTTVLLLAITCEYAVSTHFMLQYRRVTQIYQHENYGDDSRFGQDIALLLIDPPLDLNA